MPRFEEEFDPVHSEYDSQSEFGDEESTSARVSVVASGGSIEAMDAALPPPANFEPYVPPSSTPPRPSSSRSFGSRRSTGSNMSRPYKDHHDQQQDPRVVAGSGSGVPSHQTALHQPQYYTSSSSTKEEYEIEEQDDSDEIVVQLRLSGRTKRRMMVASVILLLFVAVGALAAVMASMNKSDNSSGTASSSTANSGTSVPPDDVVPAPPQPAPTPRVTAPPVAAPTTTPPTKAPTPAPLAASAAPTSEVLLLIKSRLPDGGLSLLFDNSYQNKALKWVEETYDPTQHDIGRILQRFVLACIYHATYLVETPWTIYRFGQQGAFLEWINSNGWLEADNECIWHGITCDAAGRVTEIDLSANVLTGTFPPETALLKDSLIRLNLRKNYVYNFGDAGNNWLGELTLLQDLDLSETSFHYDGLPPALGKLSNLVDLDVSYSLYFGPLPGSIFANMANLQFLSIGGNSYNASLPDTVGDLSSLLYFYADDCDLEGDLSLWGRPDKIPSLFELWIDQNPKVTGNIPPGIAGHSQLASLSLSQLGISGNIPTEIGLMTNMEQMWLFGNQLNGAIPPHIANMTKLQRLELESNNLSGSMPGRICNNDLFPFRFGQLEFLEADCDGDNPKVPCRFPHCCTCCGATCISTSQTPLGGGGGGTRRRAQRHLLRTPDETPSRRELQRQERRDRKRLMREDATVAQEAAATRKLKLAFAASHRLGK